MKLLILFVIFANVAAVLAVQCGQTPNPPNLGGFIVGGQEARPHSIPWQIGLGTLFKYGSKYYQGGQICGGSIVSDRLVVTAAHCISPNKKYYVAVGQHDKKSNSEASKKVVMVAEAITHPNWNDRRITKYDIAVLKLSEPITFNDAVQPICLPKAGASYADNAHFLVSGWGTLSEGGRGSNKLMQLVAPHIKMSTCQRYLGGNVHKDVICAGYLNGGKDSCQGDSGGPLAAMVDRKWTLAGVVSWGYGCARKGNPGVYTNVGSYTDFIEKYM